MQLLEKALADSSENTVFFFDEADSLLVDRSRIIGKNEPCDSLRMVNLLLSALDKRTSLFIFTSNFKHELDSAFISRCDLVYEMKKLNVENTYRLLKSTIERVAVHEGWITPQLLDYSLAVSNSTDKNSNALLEIAANYCNMSPREIKKQIFLSARKGLNSLLLSLQTSVYNKKKDEGRA